VYGRRTRRMIRRIDTWTVLRLCFLFYLFLGGVGIVAGTVVYNVARVAGFMARIERAMQEVGFENFRFLGARTLLAALLVVGTLVVVATAATVLLSVLYNVIAEIVGGIEVSTLDEMVDVVEVEEDSRERAAGSEHRPRQERSGGSRDLELVGGREEDLSSEAT